MGKKQNLNKREMLYMSQKAGTTKVVTIKLEDGSEKEFTLQHPGLRETMKLRGRSKNNLGHLDEELYFGEIIKHVIVQPKTNWEYWEENPEGFNTVMQEASTFLNGKLS